MCIQEYGYYKTDSDALTAPGMGDNAQTIDHHLVQVVSRGANNDRRGDARRRSAGAALYPGQEQGQGSQATHADHRG
jgi:hypothetical protein